MNRNLPSRAQSLLCRQTRIVQPALIEKLCRAVWTSGPCERRDGVDYKANVLALVFASLVFGMLQDIKNQRETPSWRRSRLSQSPAFPAATISREVSINFCRPSASTPPRPPPS